MAGEGQRQERRSIKKPKRGDPEEIPERVIQPKPPKVGAAKKTPKGKTKGKVIHEEEDGGGGEKKNRLEEAPGEKRRAEAKKAAAKNEAKKTRRKK